MHEADRFTHVLNQFVRRSAYTPGQLARLSSVPKTTIINWLNGRVVKPRSWRGIVEIAAAMRLREAEVNRLLASVQQPTIQQLKQQEPNQGGFSPFEFWEEGELHPLQPPFQAIPLPPYFVGRERDTQVLKKVLTQPEHQSIYALIGMAGVGKSSLAAKIAYELKDIFEDGVLWVRVDGADTMSILASFAAAYAQDVSQILDLDSRSQVVRSLLGQKRVLIILDNVQSSEQIVPLLPPTGRSAVMVTTRRHDLSILTGAKRFELKPFSAESTSSLHLFEQILGQDRVAQTPRVFAQIADRLGHLPLALKIVASRLAYEPGWEVQQFFERIGQINLDLPLLKYESQNIYVLFQISFDLLSPQLKKLFATIGMLGKQSFSVETIAALSGIDSDTSADGVRQLYSLSLINNYQNGRYELHPLVYDFSQSLDVFKLPSEKLAAYWLAFVTQHEHSYQTIEAEFSHLEVALKATFKDQLFDIFVQLLHKLMSFLFGRGMLEKAEEYVVKVEPSLSESKWQKELCFIQLFYGQIRRQNQELDIAEERFERGLRLALQLGENSLEVQFLTELGIVENCRNRFEKGKKYLLHALSLAERLELNTLPPSLFEELGILALIENSHQEACDYYQKGLKIAQAQKNDAQIVLFLKGLGSVKYLGNEPEQAIKLFEQGYMLAEKIRFLKGKMVMANNLGVVAFYADEADRAQAQLQIALGEAEKLNDKQSRGFIEKNLQQLQGDTSGFTLGNKLKVFI